MTQVLYRIELKGGAQVELLATPALFDIARKRGMAIEADADNAAEVFSAYTKLIYLAAINAWDVRRYDDAAMGDFPYRLMDFVEWGSVNSDEFVKVVNFVLSALTGKDLKDYATEQAKGSENEKKAANQADEEVKKKSILTWIMRLFGRSS
jgi:hypothetical protein